ncbi:hypothetical protein BFJ65_g1616 [Fusarium oxysporum f. sp. cepae]|uniref:Uncharacterized protein n=1 Tax=Fusarium oxysporum f. sp. cepae TaxID=396571 RepID=A0A3L6P8Q6_FUSOX|nr:hypothetical protein BFJ65_g1616 [Fusarium oxysporum f. sp. cepae]
MKHLIGKSLSLKCEGDVLLQQFKPKSDYLLRARVGFSQGPEHGELQTPRSLAELGAKRPREGQGSDSRGTE